MASQYGLDAKRVLAVLRRIDEVEGWRSPSWERPLVDAARAMGGEAALALFEVEDLAKLRVRVRETKLLSNPYVPLCTVGRLRRLLQEFLAQQERNRGSLLRFGHPASSFAGSAFLDWHLSRLYYTRFPLTVQAGRTPHPMTA